MAKIISFKKACELSKKFRKEGKKVALVKGCFDILHVGHIRFLKLIRKYIGKESILFLGLTSDEYMSKYKGPNRPIYSQKERAEVLSSLELLDYVITYSDNGTVEDIQKRHGIGQLNPNVFILGKTEEFVVKRLTAEANNCGCRIKVFPHEWTTPSTSKLAKLILDNFSS